MSIDDPGAELAKLSSETLEWLYSQVYDPADRGMKRAIEHVFWVRHATPLEEWPAWQFGTSAPEWTSKLGDGHVITYCRKGSGHRDLEHRALRQMAMSSHRVKVECSCGAVADLFDLKIEQRFGSVLVWPVEKIDGIPHFVICSQAKFADDPKHAPRWTPEIEARCICGWTLDPERADLRKLPAY